MSYGLGSYDQLGAVIYEIEGSAGAICSLDFISLLQDMTLTSLGSHKIRFSFTKSYDVGDVVELEKYVLNISMIRSNWSAWYEGIAESNLTTLKNTLPTQLTMSSVRSEIPVITTDLPIDYEENSIAYIDNANIQMSISNGVLNVTLEGDYTMPPSYSASFPFSYCHGEYENVFDNGHSTVLTRAITDVIFEVYRV